MVAARCRPTHVIARKPCDVAIRTSLVIFLELQRLSGERIATPVCGLARNDIRKHPHGLGGVRKTVKAKLQNTAWLLSLFALHSKTLCIEVRPWYAQKNGIEQTRHPNRLSR